MGIFNEKLDRRHESQTVNRGKPLLNSLSRYWWIDKIVKPSLGEGLLGQKEKRERQESRSVVLL